MKKIVLFGLFFFIINQSKAQTDFITQYYGPTGNQIIVSSVSKNNAVYSVGNTDAFGSGLTDGLLLKTNLYGDTIFTKTYGGASNDEFRKVKFLHDGNLLMAGSTVSFSSYGAFDMNMMLVKTNLLGNVIWCKSINAAANQIAIDFFENPDGSIIILGSTVSANIGGTDVCLVKISSTGDFIWSKSLGGTNDEVATSITNISNSGYIISGHTKSFGLGAFYPFVLAVDTAGKFKWAKAYDNKYHPSSIVGNGNCITHGFLNDYIFVGKDGMGSVGDALPFVLSIDSLGNINWDSEFVINTGDCAATSVITTADHHYLIAGYMGNYYGLLFQVDTTGHGVWINNYNSAYKFFDCTETSNGYLTSGFSVVSSQNQATLMSTDLSGTVYAGCYSPHIINTNSLSVTPIITSLAFSNDSAIYNTIDSCKVNSAPLSINKTCLSTPTSINQFNNSSLNIYPNPAQKNFTVEVSNNDKQQLQVLDISGKIVLTQTIQSKTTIDASMFENGVYFIQLKSGAGVSMQKLVVQH